MWNSRNKVERASEGEEGLYQAQEGKILSLFLSCEAAKLLEGLKLQYYIWAKILGYWCIEAVGQEEVCWIILVWKILYRTNQKSYCNKQICITYLFFRLISYFQNILEKYKCKHTVAYTNIQIKYLKINETTRERTFIFRLNVPGKTQCGKIGATALRVFYY